MGLRCLALKSVIFVVPWTYLFKAATFASLLAEVHYVIPCLVFTEAIKCLACAEIVDGLGISPISALDLMTAGGNFML